MWGWTEGGDLYIEGYFVNPTYVGMDRLAAVTPLGLASVNPTYVGMDRHLTEVHRRTHRKPHVCGDGPSGGGAASNLKA